jgi:putative hydrolase of the HAD superfamily
MNTKLHKVITSKKGIIFDLFHTLTANKSELKESLFKYTYQVLGVSRQEWEKQLFEQSRFRLSGEERDHLNFISKMARSINPLIDDSLIKDAVNNRANRFSEKLLNIPEHNITLLKVLRSHSMKLGLVSNADCGEISSWNLSPLASYFDSAVFSCYVGYVKPEPEIFLRCLSDIGLFAGDCLFVGDGGSQELLAASRLGFTTIMVTGVIQELWPEQIEKRARDADYIVKFPIDILPKQWKHPRQFS